MGLDMYAHRVAKTAVVDDFSYERKEFDFRQENEIASELHYWRKHHDLHGWMENLYREKGGQEEFNCVSIRLDSDDLDRLETDLEEANLPETTGFFFGSNPPDEETITDDMKFIRSARQAIKEGDAVYYSSWW